MAFSKQLTELFGKAKGAVSEHVENILNARRQVFGFSEQLMLIASSQRLTILSQSYDYRNIP